jgi:hypothetical protein
MIVVAFEAGAIFAVGVIFFMMWLADRRKKP